VASVIIGCPLIRRTLAQYAQLKDIAMLGIECFPQDDRNVVARAASPRAF
jgi:F0F1-type ATP synthase beta subunit